MLHLRSRLLEDLEKRAVIAVSAKVDQSKSRVSTAAASLSALSPISVLTRGYSMTADENGRTIESIENVHVGQTVVTKLNDGQFISRVTKTE